MSSPTLSRTVFHVGSYCVPGAYFHATGEGLTACALDEVTGEISRLSVRKDVGNAGWLARSGGLLVVAADHYLEAGEISASTLRDGGTSENLGAPQSSMGGAFCHVAISPNGRTAFAASYLGGLIVHHLDSNDGVSAAHQHITYSGSGPNKERQGESHPHQAAVTPDGSQVLVCDLGCDKIWVHPFDGTSLGEAVGIAIQPGSGPRHLVIHPKLPRLYLMCELDAKLRVLEATGQTWREIAVHATLPDEFTGEPAGCAIHFHPGGKSLLVSNRNSNSITVFAVNAAGDLARAAVFPCQGETPREFAISPSGRWLLVVNQDSHQIVPFELDPASGLPTGHAGPAFACGSPMCLTF
ncbi:MAG TPA: lactonase family protein [Luteolibacter sp.]